MSYFIVDNYDSLSYNRYIFIIGVYIMYSTGFLMWLIGFLAIFWAQGMPLSFEILELFDHGLIFAIGLVVSFVGFFMIVFDCKKDNLLNCKENLELTDLRPTVLSILSVYNAICIPTITIENGFFKDFFSRSFVDVLKDFFYDFDNFTYFSVWMPMVVFISSLILCSSLLFSTKKSFKIISILSSAIVFCAIIKFFIDWFEREDITVYLYDMSWGTLIALTISVLAIITAFTPPKPWAYGLSDKIKSN